MSIRKMTEVWESKESDRGTLLVLLALADWCNEDGICWPKIATIADRSRLEERQVRRILKKLQEDGRIEVEAGRGRGNANRYKLNLSPCPVLVELKPVILDTEKGTFSQEKGTFQAGKPDISDSAIRKEPLEPLEPSVNHAAELASAAKIDPRFLGFRDVLYRYHGKFVAAKCPFDVWFGNRGAKNLKALLRSEPKLELKFFERCVANRARSLSAKHESPVYMWIGTILEFSGGPQQGKFNGNGKQVTAGAARTTRNAENIVQGLTGARPGGNAAGDGRHVPHGDNPGGHTVLEGSLDREGGNVARADPQRVYGPHEQRRP